MNQRIRVAVTGSRGKSGVVRLIHAALCACGLKTYSRITGVVPRQLTCSGENPILRPSGGNVAEMKWWLSTVPGDAEAVVLENSAVAPDLQGLCARWLSPTVSVLTNVRPDHESQWGPDELHVLKSLLPALPEGGAVVLPKQLAGSEAMQCAAREKKLRLLPCVPFAGLPPHRAANTALALEVCFFSGLDRQKSLAAMSAMPPDFADFCVLPVGSGRLAFAFSANDVQTTEELFQSLAWRRSDTGVLFNHRADRIDRFRCFESWLSGNPWREVLIIGDSPPRSDLAYSWLDCPDVRALASRLDGQTWFGCGNTVYGLPLELKLSCEEGSLKL
ncbi:MAG: Mur ligase family protein [Pyramidobacter sp.]|nr:Mur ligase family protein [Pyramidobacter sp.]